MARRSEGRKEAAGAIAGRPELAGDGREGQRRAAFQTETIGRERRARGTRPGLGRGRRKALAAAPWPMVESSSGERGRGATRLRFARQKDGERAGGERKLTKATKRSKKGSNQRDDAGWRLMAKWGGEGGARLYPLLIRARGGEKIVGAWGRLGGLNKERG